MLRLVIASTLVTIFAAMPAVAQNYSRDPPPGYMSAPPPDWEREDFWRHRKEEERHAFWEHRRHAAWRCDHGDRDACHWLREHERG